MGINTRQTKGADVKFGNLERTFSNETYANNIDKMNTGLTKLGFVDNFPGKIFTIPELKKDGIYTTATEFKYQGYLILNQEGNGVLSSTGRGDKFEIINYGPDLVKNIKIFVME